MTEGFYQIHIEGVSEFQVENETAKVRTENKIMFMDNEKLENHSFLSNQ